MKVLAAEPEYDSAQNRRYFCILAAVILLGILLLPALLPIALLVLFGLALLVCWNKCKEKCEKRRNEMKTRESLQKEDDEEAAVPLGMMDFILFVCCSDFPLNFDLKHVSVL